MIQERKRYNLSSTLRSIVAVAAVGLCVLLLIDVISVIQKVKQVQTSLEYREFESWEVPLAVILLPTVKRKGQPRTSVSIENECDCRLAHEGTGRWRSGMNCSLRTVTQKGVLREERSALQDIHLHIFEMPPFQNVRQYLRINCTHRKTEYLELSLYTVALYDSDVDTFSQRNTEKFNLSVLWLKHMANHHRSLLTTGHFNSVLMNKRVFQRLGQAENLVNTIIDVSTSKTPTGDEHYTEVTAAWDLNIYLHAKEVTTGSYFGVVTVVATYALAIEKAVTLYKNL